MFKKTYLKTIRREIQGNFGRFVAVFAIVALGVGFLAGLTATTPDMKISLNRYFAQANMMDIFIKGTMGLTRADADALKALPPVDKALPAYVTDALVTTSHDETLVARIYGLPLERMGEQEMVNRVELLEGRLPKNDRECLAQQGGGYLSAVPMGTTLTIIDETLHYHDFESLDALYNVTRYTVTGIVKNPLYISTEREPSPAGNGRLGTVIYVYESAYALPAYTDMYITLKTPPPGFSEPYQAFVDQVKGAIEALGLERSLIRRDEIAAEAAQKLGAANDAIATGEAELRDAAIALAQGRNTFAAQRQSVAEEFAQAEADIQNGEAAIASARQTLAESKSQLDAALSQIDAYRNKWYAARSAKLRAGITQYEEGLAAYNAGLATVTEKERELEQGKADVNAGRQQAHAEFARAEWELDRAQADINAGWARLADARRQLAEGDAAYRERLAPGKWYVLDRNANVGCMNYKANTEKLDDVSGVFPVFFLLIATLVALTTMTRMVEEERIQIGTLKALGYRKRTILGKYLTYCGLTGVFGSIAGMALGFQVLPVIIYNAFVTIYHLPPLITVFNWPFGLIACGVVLSCTTGATVYACYRSLWEKPASLMLPRPPKAGKRVFLEYMPFIWNRMKFTYKVTARNLIRQKKHFCMTITGIAGCTALMTAAFGLRDSVTSIAQTQFEDILTYDLQIELRDETAAGDLPRVLKDWTPIHSESGYIVKGNERFNLAIIVPQIPDELPKFISLRDRRAQTPLPFSGDQAILTEKAAERLGLKVGDAFTLENAKGVQGVFTLTGITENYVGITAYLGPQAYAAQWGGVLTYRTLFAHTGIREQAAQDRLIAALLAQDTVLAAQFIAQIQATYHNLLGSINYVVLIIIFAAGGLAMIVLYNLTNININERTREIATLRVLGFSRAEAAAYIFREITVLSIAGAAAGLCLGVPFHRFVIRVSENPDLMFGRDITPLSFILSGVITLLFSAGVDLFMLRKLGSIKMADSMKAVD